MREPTIAVVGAGVVGTHVAKQFGGLVWATYDVDPLRNDSTQNDVNACDAAFVCVPSPMGCPRLAVDEVFRWLRTPLVVIRSTVPVGTTDDLQRNYRGDVVYQPEYYGESVGHRQDWDFSVLGGLPTGLRAATALWLRVVPPDHRFYYCTPREAEMAKYAENCYHALKVGFVSELHDACESAGLCFERVREAWLADPRVGRDHSAWIEPGGFGGKCLPKDLRNFLAQYPQLALLAALDAENQRRRPECYPGA